MPWFTTYGPQPHTGLSLPVFSTQQNRTNPSESGSNCPWGACAGLLHSSCRSACLSESPCSIETLWLKCSVSYLLGVMKWRLGWFISPGRSGSMWKQMTSVHFHQAKVQFAHKEWCINNKWDWTLHFQSRSSENVLKSFPGTLKVEGTHGWCLKNALALKNMTQPWLVWLNGLSASPQTKKLLVQFPVRALGCVWGPLLGHVRGNHTLMFLSLSFSLPSPLSKNK